MSTKKTGPSAGGLSKVKWAYMAISLFLMALGVLTFLRPDITAGAIITVLGVASIVFGIISILAYFMREVKGVALSFDFSIGALAVIAGLILLISRERVVGLLQVVIGVYLVVDSVFKLQAALDAKRLGVGGWWLSLVVTAACLALGIVLILKLETDLLMLLIGAALVADGLQNLFLVIFSAVAARTLARRAKAEAEAAAEPAPEPAPIPVMAGAPAAEEPVPMAQDPAVPAETEPSNELQITEGSK